MCNIQAGGRNSLRHSVVQQCLYASCVATPFLENGAESDAIVI